MFTSSSNNSTTPQNSGKFSFRKWLDPIAVCMSGLCAVHCIVTPFLLVLLPSVASSFFAREDFHLWMVLLILPTTAAAIYFGCRQHKDKFVLSSSVLGLCILMGVAVSEASAHTGEEEAAHCELCVHCEEKPTELALSSIFSGHILVNLLGGSLLATAHIRNFSLCRKDKCTGITV